MSDSQDPAPAGEPNTDAAGQPDADAGSPQNSDSPDANALAARLRKSEKALQQAQQRLAQVEQAKADKAKAEMTETERYKTEAAELKKQLEQTQSRFVETQKHNAFRLAAQQAGAIDVNAALKLADLSTVDFDGDHVVGVDAAIKALKKSSPYLFGSSQATASSGGGNPSGGAPNVKSKDIASMTPDEYKAFRSKVASGEIKL